MARVMIIDDDLMLTRSLGEQLSSEGHEVQSFSMAEEGFAAATQTPPDLIFVDVMLPDATGFQIVGRLRQHPKTKTLPIIMISGTATRANQVEIGKKIMGADEYLVKPLDAAIVTEKMRQLLGGKAVSPAVPAPEPVIEETPAKLEPEPEPVPPIPEPIIEPILPIPEPEELAPAPEPIPDPAPEPIPEPAAVPIREPMPEPVTLPPFELPEFSPITFMSETPVPARAEEKIPLEKPMEAASLRFPKMRWAAALFLVHAIATLGRGLETQLDFQSILRSERGLLAGWALLLGLLTAACGGFRILLTAEQAIGLLIWPAVPIVLRSLASLAGYKLDPLSLAPQLYWLRPLDVFEMASILLLGVNIRRLPNGSLAKAVYISMLMAIAWCLTNRGYFQP